MVLKKTCIVPVLLILLSTNGCSQRESPEIPWFFIQLTDPQFGMFENNNGFEKETYLYEKAVVHINRLKPDFVVITGDFVHNGGSSDQIEEFKRITAMIDHEIPVYYTPGNHDVGQIPDEESLENYTGNYGRDRFSFRHKGSVFIGFNSSLIKARLTEPEQKQYKWLSEKLKQSRKAQHIILFCHYPFFNKSFDEPSAYSNIDIEYRKKYLDLFNASKVEAVFSGHYHNNSLSVFGNTQLVTTSALGKPLGDAPSGMRIIKVYSNRIEHEYFGLDELPDSVNFNNLREKDQL
ncbi:MAG: metallophosphoesterase [Bacteroidales bacterium]|jgi:3',5'-cyclic AMP phosphodiesterase CpdA|nr:metallophosphoesterase [Bacteroidales bacterium]